MAHADGQREALNASSHSDMLAMLMQRLQQSKQGQGTGFSAEEMGKIAEHLSELHAPKKEAFNEGLTWDQLYATTDDSSDEEVSARVKKDLEVTCSNSYTTLQDAHWRKPSDQHGFSSTTNCF